MPKAASGVEFNHAMLYTGDVAKSVAFYVDRIGFKVVEIFEWQKRPVYARLKAPRGSGTLALHHPEPGQSVPPSDGVRLYFEVKDSTSSARSWKGRAWPSRSLPN